MRYWSVISTGVTAALLAGWVWGGEDVALKFKLRPGAEGKVCLTCHETFGDLLKKPHVHTPVKDGACTGCHSPHSSQHGKLLAAAPKDVCGTCHDSVLPNRPVSVHKVVADGECRKCHDPHASDNPANLVKPGNALCLDCHKSLGEAVKKAKFKHSPVEDGCVECHSPHGSAKAGFLLKEQTPVLCGGCHDTGQPGFAKAHMGYPVAAARCTSCHDPHGSSQKGLLYDNAHSPVAKRMCSQCHQEAQSPDALKTRKAGFELCRGCHNDRVNEMLGKDRVHWPLLDKTGCLSCHDPHAGRAKRLLKAEPGAVCGRCHQDTVKRQEASATKHPPMLEGKCTACHDPHSSNQLFLATKANVPDWCGTCHDWQKHSTHPLGDKVKDPRNPNLSVQCLSCHQTHGTEYKHMIPFASVSDLCTQCHDQYKR